MLSKKIASSLMSLIAIFALVFVASSAKAVGFEVPIPNETRIPKDGYLVIATVRDNPALLYNLGSNQLAEWKPSWSTVESSMSLLLKK